jgi:hypothetical protein
LAKTFGIDFFWLVKSSYSKLVSVALTDGFGYLKWLLVKPALNCDQATLSAVKSAFCDHVWAKKKSSLSGGSNIWDMTLIGYLHSLTPSQLASTHHALMQTLPM